MTGSSPAPLAVTMGEPAGIGGEIALKAWTRRAEGLAPFFIIDDPARLQSLARNLGLAAPIKVIERPGEAAAIFVSALPVLKTSLAADTVPGKPEPANAEAVMAAIETAVRLTMDGEAGAVVTNPIHKSTLYKAGFSYPGHTEFLAALSGIDTAPVMMLAADDLRVVPVTIHESLRDATEILNPGQGWPSPGSIPMPAKTAPWDRRKPRSSAPPSRPFGMPESRPSARYRPIRCLRRESAKPSTPPFACTTIRP